MTPTLGTDVSSLPPEGAELARGGPSPRSMAPTLGTGVSLLPPEGVVPPQGGVSAERSSSLLLEVKNLRVSFAGKEVVRGIDFSIASGEKLALVGESGSGKTVTALSLLRLVQNAEVSGQALFAGPEGASELLSVPERALRGIRGRDIAMIFQEPMTALNPLFSVGDQIAEVVQLKSGLTLAESVQVAIKLLANTGIPEAGRRARSFPHQLSGGQRQRAMIAMALACKPRLLLADEIGRAHV